MSASTMSRVTTGQAPAGQLSNTASESSHPGRQNIEQAAHGSAASEHGPETGGGQNNSVNDDLIFRASALPPPKKEESQLALLTRWLQSALSSGVNISNNLPFGQAEPALDRNLGQLNTTGELASFLAELPCLYCPNDASDHNHASYQD